jgi:hypothetical protein
MVDSASMLTAFVFASFLYLVYIFWLVCIRGDSGDEGCFDLTDFEAKVIGWVSFAVMLIWGVFLTLTVGSSKLSAGFVLFGGMAFIVLLMAIGRERIVAKKPYLVQQYRFRIAAIMVLTAIFAFIAGTAPTIPSPSPKLVTGNSDTGVTFDKTITVQSDYDGRRLDDNTPGIPVTNITISQKAHQGATYMWVERQPNGELTTRTTNTRPVTIIEDLPETDTEAKVTYTQNYLVDSAALAEGKPLCSAHGTLSPPKGQFCEGGKVTAKPEKGYGEITATIHVPKGKAAQLITTRPEA